MEAGGDREGWGGGRSELWCGEVVGSGAFHPAGTSNTWTKRREDGRQGLPSTRRCFGGGATWSFGRERSGTPISILADMFDEKPQRQYHVISFDD
jgi:hypothetical protein